MGKPKKDKAPELGPNPFEWPDYERNLYINGTMATFGGLSTTDMNREALITFVGFLDGQLSALYFENQSLKGAYDETDGTGTTGDRQDGGTVDGQTDGAGV